MINIPLEQGLKQETTIDKEEVEEQVMINIPLEQGLKLN